MTLMNLLGSLQIQLVPCMQGAVNQWRAQDFREHIWKYIFNLEYMWSHILYNQSLHSHCSFVYNFIWSDFFWISGLQGEHKDICSQPNTQVSTECSFEVLSRFMFMIGHIALRQMLYLDVAVFCELKRRNMLREERDEALNTKSKNKKKQQRSSKNSLQNTLYVSMSASETPRNRQVMNLFSATVD